MFCHELAQDKERMEETVVCGETSNQELALLSVTAEPVLFPVDIIICRVSKSYCGLALLPSGTRQIAP